MSSQPGDNAYKQDHEHGTTGSYVIGFILSLIFTLIPYYLVDNHTVSGMALLMTIMGFAVLQAIIQITFFLHLGRGPKPKWNLFFFVSTVGIILVVVGGSIVIINNLHYNMQPSDQTKKLIADEGIYQIDGLKTGACQVTRANHQVTIKNGQAMPLHTIANICDTLTFIDEDNTARVIGFGVHPYDVPYAGVGEVAIRKGQNLTLTLSEPGTYQFHDHLHYETAGDFMVKP
jgi:cytochrome o ubiquinol oxidase operon protein cyoD